MYGEMFHRDVRQQVQLFLESFQTIYSVKEDMFFICVKLFFFKKRGSLLQKNCLWAVTNTNTNFQDDLLRIIDKAGHAEGFLNTCALLLQVQIFLINECCQK